MVRQRMIIGTLGQSFGAHVAGWRRPDVPSDISMNIELYKHVASEAERGKLHYLFVADVLGMRDWPLDVLVRVAQHTLLPEPVTLMAALATVTSQIGLVATASTTFTEPYALARQFASIDLLSKGRAAWNVVTSAQKNEYDNFGRDRITPHAERYERATEFVEVVRKLWDTVESGVVIGDKQSGRLFDAAKLHKLYHDGKFFKSSGVLNVPPSPQGRPLVVQAGASGPGRALAATYAELIFASAPTMEVAYEYRSDIRRRAALLGRDPAKIVVTPGLVPIIGRTVSEAQDRVDAMDALVDPSIGLTILSDMLGNVDLSGYPLDGPMPKLAPAELSKSETIAQQMIKLADDQKLTIRQLAVRVATAHVHPRVVGTADNVADVMEEWFRADACDGFLIFPYIPGDLTLFVDEVLPILRKRGLFQNDYHGTTLRENLFGDDI